VILRGVGCAAPVTVSCALNQPRSRALWPKDDLARRTVDALKLAKDAVGTLIAGGVASRAQGDNLLSTKIVAETAMLLLFVASISNVDERIPSLLDEIATSLIPHARSQHVLASICMEPGLAVDHAVAHLILSRLGYPDAAVDRLLAQALAMGPDFGPERLDHRRLEREWLARLWPVGDGRSRRDARKTVLRLSESMLARPLDALGSSRLDCYAFTHSLMYASNLGSTRITLPRPRSDIAADATAALAFGLDGDDFDLTAEVLLTWPILRLAWSPSASFAFRVVADVQDELGFLPGLSFDRSRYEHLHGSQRRHYALATSYHTIFVMGFLSAAALLPGRAPAACIPTTRRRTSCGPPLRSLFDRDSSRPRWLRNFAMLSARQQHSIAPLLVAMLLRRAKEKGDLSLIHECLSFSLRHDLIDGSATRQAAALIRRAAILGELASHRS
jgi:hypothetical protein